MSFAEAYTEPKRATSYAEEYLIKGCMAAKGYCDVVIKNPKAPAATRAF